jgi:hypothetical protein
MISTGMRFHSIFFNFYFILFYYSYKTCLQNFKKLAPSGSQVITNEFFETRAKVGPGLDLLDRANAGPGPGTSEGGPDFEVQGQV